MSTMHRKNLACQFFCFFVFIIGIQMPAFCERVNQIDFGGETWDQIKGKHFIIYYHPDWSVDRAKNVLRVAEDYYQRIGDMVGLTRYTDFWTWDQRAKIFIFSDQRSFSKRTGASTWSMGYSDRDSYLFQSRAIVTYQQEGILLGELLPHEISHLILHDHISFEHLPVWVDEGVSQLQEKGKYEVVDRMMYALVRKGQYIKFSFLNEWDIRKEPDAQKVEVFYAQSLSVIRFLRDRSTKNFRRFCRNLRDGKSMDEALRFAYSGTIRSLQDLEKLWLAHIKTLH